MYVKSNIVYGEKEAVFVTRARHVRDYCVEVEFSDGVKKVVDLKPRLQRGALRVLLDPVKFRELRVKGGTIFWDYDHGPGYVQGLDIAPETLYDVESIE